MATKTIYEIQVSLFGKKQQQFVGMAWCVGWYAVESDESYE
jgi:hypothetical protein